MIFRLAIRSLHIRPVRTAVLACGFGLGIAVMAELLGVGEVILEQARSPALQGGGDVLISGLFGSVDSARYLLSSVLGAGDLGPRVRAASPFGKATLYLIKPGMVVAVNVRGGVPSLEKAVGDLEVAGQPAWVDAPGDERWLHPDPAAVLRSMDRFHPRPDAPDFASSWAEWLYFNGRTADGGVRFYLTFLASPSARAGTFVAGVRLQLERAGRVTNYSSLAEVDERTLLARAPDLDFGDNQVRLENRQYRIALRLRSESAPSRSVRASPRLRSSHGVLPHEVTGELTLDARGGRSLPPSVIRGARGWLSGYVVPVLSGALAGALEVDGEKVSLEGARGYHDHNWGFWQDVRWQWGQVAGDDLSFVYGRVFPPASVADPERMPGFLAVLGPQGPIALSSNVSIAETAEGGAPREMAVAARGPTFDIHLAFSVERSVRSELAMTGGEAAPMDFLQLAGTYRVTGHAGERTIDFAARGAAETFRPR